MALPNFEIIEVDSPPFSPISFADDSFDGPGVEEVTSPLKRARSIGKVKRSKRQKKIREPSFERVFDEVPTSDPTEEFSYNTEAVVDSYARYTIAVEEKLAGFYPLLDDLFIVQGWDDKTHGVKPVSSILSAILINSPYCRMHGITCNMLLQGMTCTSRVSVPKVAPIRKPLVSMKSIFENTIRSFLHKTNLLPFLMRTVR